MCQAIKHNMNGPHSQKHDVGLSVSDHTSCMTVPSSLDIAEFAIHFTQSQTKATHDVRERAKRMRSNQNVQRGGKKEKSEKVDPGGFFTCLVWRGHDRTGGKVKWLGG